MSDISSPPESPLPEAGHDPTDPNDPDRQDADTPSAPIGNPHLDVDADSDNDSILSDIDEAQFEDFDPANIAIEDRPAIAVDEGNVHKIGRHKRTPGDGVDGEVKKKKKEGRREKVKKQRKRHDSDEDDFSGGQEVEGKRRRKPKADVDGGERRKDKAKTRERIEEDEEGLTPEERRRRALDREMDAAIKNPTRRRRRADGIDLNAAADEEIHSLRIRMAEAAELDVRARSSVPPQPARHKLLLLPEVTALLNRNSRDVESAIVDPENNLLESVRFFLEPLSDGSLPALNIQRELFAALARLPIDKEALVSSGIGKVVLFYEKSKKPEPSIKRAARRLLFEWTRPLLNRSDDYRKRNLPTIDYDPLKYSQAGGVKATQQMSQAERDRLERQRQLATPVKNPNRARMENEVRTFHVVPRSNGVQGGAFARPLGASGEDAFRRMKARGLAGRGVARR
ncbi:MAG: hypothetical protein Q9191_005591 [Dirinaria sp. TL-2023a]